MQHKWFLSNMLKQSPNFWTLVYIYMYICILYKICKFLSPLISSADILFDLPCFITSAISNSRESGQSKSAAYNWASTIASQMRYYPTKWTAPNTSLLFWYMHFNDTIGTTIVHRCLQQTGFRVVLFSTAIRFILLWNDAVKIALNKSSALPCICPSIGRLPQSAARTVSTKPNPIPVYSVRYTM